MNDENRDKTVRIAKEGAGDKGGAKREEEKKKFKPVPDGMFKKNINEAESFDLKLGDGSSLEDCRLLGVDQFNIMVESKGRKFLVPKHSIVYVELKN